MNACECVCVSACVRRSEREREWGEWEWVRYAAQHLTHTLLQIFSARKVMDSPPSTFSPFNMNIKWRFSLSGLKTPKSMKNFYSCFTFTVSATKHIRVSNKSWLNPVEFSLEASLTLEEVSLIKYFFICTVALKGPKAISFFSIETWFPNLLFDPSAQFSFSSFILTSNQF